MIDGSMIDPLREYVRTGSPEVFKDLVDAHVDAVYSQCMRQLHDPAAADEVTQQVFITLAQKAARIPPNSVLNGWLFTATRYCCANYKRAAGRRRSAERKAANMRNEVVEPSGDNDFRSQAEPILDDAIAHLGRSDRDALLLRYFQGRSNQEVGITLGVSEDAAKKRISRAIEKLRIYFARQGLTVPQATLAAFLGEAIKPAAPGVAHAAFHAVAFKSAAGGAGHAAGLLSRTLWTWPKIAASIVATGAITAAVVVAWHSAAVQSPVPSSPAAVVTPILADAAASQSNVPATQPMSQATPLDALSKLCAGMEGHDKAMIDECLCDDGNDAAMAALGRAWVEETGYALRFENAWQDKFGAASGKLVLGEFDDFPGGEGDYATLYRGTLDVPNGPEITIDGDVAHVKVPLSPETFAGTGPDRNVAKGRWSGAMLVFNRVGDNWKLNTDRTFDFVIDIDREAGNDEDVVELGNKMLQGLNVLLNELAPQIENGTIKSAGQGASAVKTRTLKIMRDAHLRNGNITVLPVIGG
jgi:RNA polymerase sigma factor (sigma-70 family)